MAMWFRRILGEVAQFQKDQKRRPSLISISGGAAPRTQRIDWMSDHGTFDGPKLG